MTKSAVWLVSLMITSLLGPGPVFGQAVVRGIVLTDSTGIPLVGATIEIPRLSRAVTSDARGLFLLADVPVGKHTVLARAIGYQPRALSIWIAQSDTLRLVFRLQPAPVNLDPIVVEGQTAMALNPLMAGFSERRRFGQGEFLGPAELERLAQTSLPGALRQFGMSIRSSARGRPYATGRRGGSCAVQVFLDGIPQPNLPQPFDLSSVPMDQLAGVEYYVGIATVPVLFARGDSACGVLVLWTRMRGPS